MAERFDIFTTLHMPMVMRRMLIEASAGSSLSSFQSSPMLT